MVKYYLSINDNVEKTYLIGRFMEAVIAPEGVKKRQLHITLHTEAYTEGDSILIELADFYPENSIQKLTVLDETKENIVYQSVNYNHITNLSGTLQNLEGSGEDGRRGMEYSVTLDAVVGEV